MIDGRGCLATPGLVNTHHHLYQWATRGLAPAGDALRLAHRALPGLGAASTTRSCGAAAAAGLAALALSGCTTSTDHHYVFPRDGGDLLEAEIDAAARDRPAVPPVPRLDGPGRVGRRAAAGRGRGGPRRVLAATEAAIDRYHDPAPGAMLRIAVAPCSPFSVDRAS